MSSELLHLCQMLREDREALGSEMCSCYLDMNIERPHCDIFYIISLSHANQRSHSNNANTHLDAFGSH